MDVFGDPLRGVGGTEHEGVVHDPVVLGAAVPLAFAPEFVCPTHVVVVVVPVEVVRATRAGSVRVHKEIAGFDRMVAPCPQGRFLVADQRVEQEKDTVAFGR